MNVIFWDIDQTLINTGHAGYFAIRDSLKELMGSEASMPVFDAGGRTDNFICLSILKHAMHRDPTTGELYRFCRRYEEILLNSMKKAEGRVLPGVQNILEAFDRNPEYDQLLITGNSETGARHKLEWFRLSRFFDFNSSGFAENSFYRKEVARRAMARARGKWGNRLERVFVIGDTQYDIMCGRDIGGYTIAVATGTHSFEELNRYHPWWCVQELPAVPVFEKKLKERAEHKSGFFS